MTPPADSLKPLLAELNKALKHSDLSDPETIAMLRGLDAEIDSVLANESSGDDLGDIVAQLESRFAVEHPIAAQTLREIIDILGKIGI
ncbi:DUF4404 family protein [Teredinibacter waterburyi]|jgi:hypothetical protein|uniref:DUF4404 family protein n=1 Tax=Teredinibacter waterburyi TaxID=1500538 RepID=UPI00165FD4FA|nr:DUF4404 family protein [Teredinibacter waterburyi]